jgi:glycosyltransferase involved in cell wall biosynthesis
MKISIIIPFKNEWDELDGILEHLLKTGIEDYSLMEVIVVNDGSNWGDGRFRPIDGIDHPSVKVVNIRQPMGVGASFDRGVEVASGDVIILQGCDILPHEGWYEKLMEAVTANPNTLGCAVCVGDKPTKDKDGNEVYTKYYGADLLFFMDESDLPLKSKLRERRGGYTNLFKGKWQEKQGDEPYEIPCLMGAFYWTSKAYYNQIHGWDTERANRFCGHRSWGHLEPYISLKSWLHGGGCTLYPDISVTHGFNRVDPHHRYIKGGRGADWMWWNKLFILETMILTPELHDKLQSFPHMELNMGVARKWIRQNWATVERIRERNRQEFKYDYHIFEDRFGYDFNI